MTILTPHAELTSIYQFVSIDVHETHFLAYTIDSMVQFYLSF